MEPLTSEELDFAVLMEEMIVDGVEGPAVVERMLSVVVPDSSAMKDYANSRCAEGDACALRDLVVTMIGQVRVLSSYCRTFSERVH